MGWSVKKRNGDETNNEREGNWLVSSGRRKKSLCMTMDRK